MLCEMCGQDVESTTRTRVEGSVLRLCPACSKFGTPVEAPPVPVPRDDDRPAPARTGMGVPMLQRIQTRTRRMEERDLYRELPDLELAADWAKRIRVAREKLTWTPEELGKRLNEKKSLVLKLESGSFRPPDEMIRKIEHLLKIRLRADPSEASPA